MNKKLKIGDITVQSDTHEAYNRSQKIPLRKKEFELLEFLVRNKNRVLNRLTILEYVWCYEARADTNTLEVHIAVLRRKLKKHHAKSLIRTIHGLGYMLCDSN
jgi:two-component system, OmpR family, response regulator ArlR